MIVFLESDKNDFTVTLNPPICASKVRMVSCSLYNSWYNLIGGIVMTKDGNTSKGNAIPNGQYTPQTLAKELAKYGWTLTTGLPHEMTIKHNMAISGVSGGFQVTFGQYDPLGALLGITGKTITTNPTQVHWKVSIPL